MAVGRSEKQIQWSAADSISVSSGTGQTSDALAISATAFELMVTCKADNNGAPAAGDTVTFRILYSTGDPDGSGTAEYDTSAHGMLLATLNTNTEDPAIRTVAVRPSANIKIRAFNNAASNAITCSCGIEERTA